MIREEFPTNDAYIAELECVSRSQRVAEFLENNGIHTEIFPSNSKLVDSLLTFKPDLCLNFVDTLHGSGALASSIPGIFELLNIPYVGSGTLGLALSNNKFLTKTILEAWGLPTPRYQLFRSPSQSLDYHLRFPLIVKLNEEHGSVGLDEHSVVTNDKQLKERLNFLIETYQQPALVEEFIEGGTEITGVVLEAKQTVKVFLSLRSFDTPKDQFKLVTFDTKWTGSEGVGELVKYLPYKPEDSLVRRIKNDLRKAFEILKMDDLSRFDLIIDKYQNHYLIDCNANPSLGVDTSVTRAIEANNQTFSTLMLNILQRNHQDILKNQTFA